MEDAQKAGYTSAEPNLPRTCGQLSRERLARKVDCMIPRILHTISKLVAGLLKSKWTRWAVVLVPDPSEKIPQPRRKARV